MSRRNRKPPAPEPMHVYVLGSALWDGDSGDRQEEALDGGLVFATFEGAVASVQEDVLELEQDEPELEPVTVNFERCKTNGKLVDEWEWAHDCVCSYRITRRRIWP